MSYILDALRKADAERQRGAVPGLHDQAGVAGTAAGSGAGPGRGRRLPLIIGLLVAAALVAACAVVWLRCISSTEARRSIEWESLLLIAASFGLARASSRAPAPP